MKGLFKRLSILAASLAMVFGVGLVNNEKNAKAEATIYKQTIFSAANNSAGNSSYTGTFNNTTNGFTVKVDNGNNNNNNWEGHVRFGQKKVASKGAITTNKAIDKMITRIDLTIGEKCTKVNAINVYADAKAAPTTLIGSFTDYATNKTISLDVSAKTTTDLFYKIEFDMLAGANGNLDIGQIDFYVNEDTPQKKLDRIVVSGFDTSTFYYVGDAIKASDITVTGVYEDNTEVAIETGYTVDPELPYTLTSSDVGSKTITITYEGLISAVTIIVKEKPTDLVLSEIKITEGENVKKTYYVGDSVDTTGLTVTAGYLSESDPSHESYVDVTDKVTWSLDTSAINAEAHLTATYIEGEITETTYIIVAIVEAPTYVVDKLTAADLAAESNTYTDFRDVTATSGIKYAGNSAKDSSTYIQLRSDKDKNTGSYSGIVSTTANRILTKVEVEWASKTAAARTIDVYGYNVAFNDASDLYNTKAEKLGTLKKTDTSLEIPTNTKYAFVGIRSTSGAIYLASISFTWDISSEANSFIDMWSQMRADGTNGICDYLNGSQDSSELDTLLEMYNDSSLIDAADKAIINDAADGENNTIGNTILYIAAYKAAHTSNNAGMNNAYHAVTNNISFILIISVIGLSSVLGYYFIQKRRLVK